MRDRLYGSRGNMYAFPGSCSPLRGRTCESSTTWSPVITTSATSRRTGRALYDLALLARAANALPCSGSFGASAFGSAGRYGRGLSPLS